MKSFGLSVLSTLGLLLASSVSADAAPRYRGSRGGEPATYTQRGIALAPGTLRLDTSLGFGRQEWLDNWGDSFSFLNIGLAWSPVQNLELYGLLLPIRLSPDSDFGRVFLGGTYVFADKASFGSMGVSFGVRLNRHQQLHLGLPIRFNINPAFYVEVHPSLELALHDRATNDLHLPLRIAANITPELFFRANAGLNFFDLDSELSTFGLGFGLGYTIKKGNAAFIDLSADLDFPYLVALGDFYQDFSFWQLTLGANFHFDVR